MQAAPTSSGDGQSGPPSEALPEDLRVVITRASEPQQGVEVAWATTGGGSLDPRDQRLRRGRYRDEHLDAGPDRGAQAATATVADADGSPVTFNATAESDEPPPPPPRCHHPGSRTVRRQPLQSDECDHPGR